MRMWYPIEDGHTIGTEGSEDGTIIKDDELELGARITLEKEAQRGRIPYAITCGIYGLMVHTAFADNEQEASDMYDEMKKFIEEFLNKGTSPEEDSDWLEWFTNKF